MVRILNRRFNQFQTQCNISQLEKYYNLENNENEIRNYSVEKINDNDLLLHCSYKYTPKDKNKYMIYELPLHINQKIQSYLYIFNKLCICNLIECSNCFDSCTIISQINHTTSFCSDLE